MFKTLEQVKEDHVRAVLQAYPVREHAARVLDVNIRTLRNMIRDYGIEQKNMHVATFNKVVKKSENSEKDMGYLSVTPEERDDWYNRDRY